MKNRFFLYAFPVLISVSIFYSTPSSQAQTLQWAGQIVAGIFSKGRSVTTDPDGNVYTAGNYSNIADFDPGPGTFPLVGISLHDGYIAKYDSSRNLIWAKPLFNLSGMESVASIHYADPGYLYITGFYNDSIDMDPSASNFYLTSQGGTYDIFIGKYDLSGNMVWAKTVGTYMPSAGNYDDQGMEIKTDPDGNVVVAGTFSGTGDFDPGPGVFTLSCLATPMENGFVLKLNDAGDFMWAGAFTTPGPLVQRGFDIDGDGNIYLHGNFQDTADFDPDPVDVYQLIGGSSQPGYVVKLDKNGDFIWAKSLEGAPGGSIVGNDLVVSPSGDAIFFTGQLSFGSIDFDPGPGTAILTNSLTTTDVYLASWDSSGAYRWAWSTGGMNMEDGASLATDGWGNVYIGGFFQDTVDFDPGAGTAWLYAMENFLDAFIGRYDPATGALQTITGFGSGGTSVGNEWIWGIHVDAFNHIYTNGEFQGTSDFDPGAGTVTFTAGDNDIFFQKFAQSLAVSAEDEKGGVSAQAIVYPNPSTGIFQVYAPAFTGGDIRVYSSDGREVFRSDVNPGEYSIRHLPQGIYMLRITAMSGETAVRRLVLMK